MSTAGFSGLAESTNFANINAIGFYFTDFEDYQTKVATAVYAFGQPIEELELQYIDGEFSRLFEAVRVSQASLIAWFDLLEALGGDEDRHLIARHLAGLGNAVDELADRCDDYTLFRGTAADYVAEIVEKCYDVSMLRNFV